ncbi:ABC transporter permease [Salinicola socius]|jgi:NitT/TauT family transport system permease protein|uniref:Nitrate transport permease nrtB n=1 Tax=Salinicola socius TaxID=404433 RepID=A0A1Q8SWU5_9GAMM|nr:ABC transporter permease [Salinicola socius]OLO05873.1 nitrate transport permease nrtB [Salinicola socius]
MAHASLWQRCLTPRATIPKTLTWSAGIGVWLVVIALWALVTYSGLVRSIFLPTPTAVLSAAVSMIGDGSLWKDIWSSAQVVLYGFLLSSAIAIPLGILMGSFRLAQAFLDPLVNFMRYLPVTAFVPLFILWIGIGIEQRVTVIFFGIFFQQLVMIADISRGVSQDLINASYTLGAKRRDVVTHVLFPACLPGVIDMMRVTMGWAWTFVVVAELVAANSGLGYISLKAMRGFQVDVIFLSIGLIGLLGLVTDQFFRLLRKRLTSWAL